jgi:hypothetical protein
MATAQTTANDLTRQQLDELDALLQRMLSLPINPSDPNATPAPAASLPAFTPPLPPPLSAPPFPSILPIHQTSLPFAEPYPEPPVNRRPDPPMPPPVRPSFPVPVPAPVVAKPPAPATRPTPAPQPLPAPPAVLVKPAPIPVSLEPISGIFAPLVMLNRGVNRLLGMLGTPGRLLRSGFVKNLLGITGIGLLLYTATKMAQIHGWVVLPSQLPWPQ